MKVFISWSKPESGELARKTKELLQSLDPEIDVFESELDIKAGEDVQAKILQNIQECEKLVLCFTRENQKSPWMLFEAGYARGAKKIVIPLLFDNDPNWHSWIDNPMNIAREISYNNKNFINNLLDAFKVPFTKSNSHKVEKYIQEVENIKDKFRKVDINCEDFVDKLIHNNCFILKNPYFHDKTACFLTGFESFDLLKIITEYFMYTGKYLWIYGRKNMKLLSGNFKLFFDYLEEKSYYGTDMDGIDFRCMFLNPNSDEVNNAHQHQEIFRNELKTCILRAKNIIKDNGQLRKCFRLYDNKRDEIIIRLDNCIIYSRPSFDSNGYPQLLTNTSFEVFSVESPKGQRCVKKYERVWNNAMEFNNSI